MLADCAGPSHRPLMVEFLSTFRFRPLPVGAAEDDHPPEIQFRLFGEQRQFSLRAWAMILAWYWERDVVSPIYTTAIHSMPDDALYAWWPTIGSAQFGTPKVRQVRAREIRDPLHRYLHRCITYSIAARAKSNEWVTKTDLFYLYCLITGTPCALHRCVAELYSSAARRYYY